MRGEEGSIILRILGECIVQCAVDFYRICTLCEVCQVHICVYCTSCIMLVSLIKTADIVQAYRIIVYVLYGILCLLYALLYFPLSSLSGGGGANYC